jgi:hypothetical protein
VFAAAWAWNGRRLAASAGEKSYALPAHGPAHVDFLTTVVRVPEPAAGLLLAAAERLRAIDPAHHYYDRGSLHVTVLNVNGLLDADAGARLEEVRRLVALHAPFELELRGLNLSASTVLAQAFPVGPAFGRLRRRLLRLHRARAEQTPAQALRRTLLTRIAFANVVRLSGPVSRELLREVGALRDVDVGRFEVREIELVHADRLLSPEATELVARLPLAG